MVSRIYGTIRDFAAQQQTRAGWQDGGETAVSYNQIEAMIMKKGFTAQQLQSCIEEYESLGVMRVDGDRTNIYMDA